MSDGPSRSRDRKRHQIWMPRNPDQSVRHDIDSWRCATVWHKGWDAGGCGVIWVYTGLCVTLKPGESHEEAIRRELFETPQDPFRLYQLQPHDLFLAEIL